MKNSAARVARNRHRRIRATQEIRHRAPSLSDKGHRPIGRPVEEAPGAIAPAGAAPQAEVSDANPRVLDNQNRDGFRVPNEQQLERPPEA